MTLPVQGASATLPGMKSLPILMSAFLLSGCVVGTVAKTAVDVATIPVKVASAGVDAATTSQSEADEKRGRELRRQDEERGRQARAMASRCRKGRQLPTDICATN
jgi:uncharacterized lipoprotein YajG